MADRKGQGPNGKQLTWLGGAKGGKRPEARGGFDRALKTVLAIFEGRERNLRTKQKRRSKDVGGVRRKKENGGGSISLRQSLSSKEQDYQGGITKGEKGGEKEK